MRDSLHFTKVSSFSIILLNASQLDKFARDGKSTRRYCRRELPTLRCVRRLQAHDLSLPSTLLEGDSCGWCYGWRRERHSCKSRCACFHDVYGCEYPDDSLGRRVVEMLKVRMQGQYGSPGDKRLRVVVSEMWKDWGFRKGIMRGYWVTVAREIPAYAG